MNFLFSSHFSAAPPPPVMNPPPPDYDIDDDDDLQNGVPYHHQCKPHCLMKGMYIVRS